MDNPVLDLGNGARMPALGLGVLFGGDETAPMVETAIASGYRLIDTAAAYRNEAQVGEGIRRSGIDRGELFVTTKLFLSDYGYDAALRAFDASMTALGLDYLDLYLLHWPVPRQFEATAESWRALERLQAEGRVRAIGVCNFNPDHLDRLAQTASVTPVLNQVELHPFFTDTGVSTRHGLTAVGRGLHNGAGFRCAAFHASLSSARWRG